MARNDPFNLSRLEIGSEVPSDYPNYGSGLNPFIGFRVESPLGTGFNVGFFGTQGFDILYWDDLYLVTLFAFLVDTGTGLGYSWTDCRFSPLTDGRLLGYYDPGVFEARWDGRYLINLDASYIALGDLAVARMTAAFLKNGSRAMEGTILPYIDGVLDIGSPTKRFLGGDFAGTVLCNIINPNYVVPQGYAFDPSGLTGRIWYRGDIDRFRFNQPALTPRSIVGNPMFEDLTFDNDKSVFIGKDADGVLPAASAAYRGKMLRVEGGAGVADLLYMCMKSAADTYSWVQIATG